MTSCGAPSVSMMSIAAAATAPSTQPPVIEPSIPPWSSMYMLAPTSSGEEPSTSTSSPATTRRPSRSQPATAAAVC